MKRSALFFLIAVCAALLLCGCGSGTDTTVPEHIFRYAENQSADYPTTLGAYRFAELVNERTSGRIKIAVYPDAELGSEAEIIEQLRFGGVDFARLSLSQLAEVSPSLAVLQLPFIYRDEKHMWRVLDGAIGDSFLKAAEEDNILGLSWYNAGARSFYTSAPVKSPEDLKGLSIRVQESSLMSDMVRLLGATPMPVVYSEVYSALKTGISDGAENNWPSYESMTHYEVAKYFYQNEHTRVPEMQVISSATAEKLSPEDLAVIYDCARESAMFQREEWALREERSKQACIAFGVEVTVPDENDLRVMEELCRPLYEEYAADYSDVLVQIEMMEEKQ